MKRQNIKTLEKEFAVVDRLVEHYDEGIEEKKKKNDKLKENSTKEEPSRLDDKVKMKKLLKCWICEEPHMVKNFPSRPKVAAISQSNLKKKEENFVGVMHILGVVVAMEAVSRRDPKRNKLEYVEMKVGSGDVLTMVDSRETHNFMSKDTARSIGMKFVQM